MSKIRVFFKNLILLSLSLQKDGINSSGIHVPRFDNCLGIDRLPLRSLKKYGTHNGVCYIHSTVAYNQKSKLSVLIFMKKLLTLVMVLAGVAGMLSPTVSIGEEVSKKPFFSKKAEPPTTLRLLIWEGYISEEIKKSAEKELNIIIEEKKIGTNKEFTELVKASETSRSYDVVMPTDYMVSWLMNTNDEPMIEPVDYSTFSDDIHFMRFLRQNEELQDLYKYAVPYLFGTLAIGYSSEFGDIPLSWGTIFDPIEPNDDSRRQFLGRMSIPYDMRDSLGIALLYLGFSLNSTEEKEVEAAGDLIIRAMDKNLLRLQVYNQGRAISENKLLIAGAWSGEIAQVMSTEKGRNVRFSMPDEGGILFVEFLAIMKKSQNKKKAQELIKFLLRPSVAATVTNERYYGSTNEKALALVKRPLINGAPYYIPSSPNVRKSFDVETEQLYERVWKQVTETYEAKEIDKQADRVSRAYLP